MPQPPSPAALFVRRVFSGSWGGAALAALVPALVLLVLAGGLGTWSQHEWKGDAVSWSTRSRIALALSVQGLGGHASLPAPRDTRYADSLSCGAGYDDSGSSDGSSSTGGYDDGSSSDGGSSDDGGFSSDGGSSDGGYLDDGGSSDGGYLDDGGSSDGGYSGFSASDSSSDCGAHGKMQVSVVPLGFTLVWLLALILVLRAVRARTAGPEAAVRVALLSAVASTALAFYAQPTIGDGSVHTTLQSGPWRVLPWSFLLSLVTALVVLNGPALRARLGAAYRVLSAALLSLVATVLFAGVVVYAVAIGNHDKLQAPGLIAAATILPNLGLSGLGLGWGAPFKASENAGYSAATHHFSFGLTRLNDFWGGAATPLAVLGGALCALAIGAIAAGRTRTRGEQLGVAAVFTVMFWAMAAIGGLTTSGYDVTGFSEGGGIARDHFHLGTSLGEALLLALLWAFGGVLAAPFIRRVFGATPPGGPGYVAPSPYAPPPAGYGPAPYGQAPAAYVPTQPAPPQGQQPPPAPQAGEVHDLGVVQPDRLTKREEGRDGGSSGGDTGGAHR
ncbi:MAG: hypothetical protein HOY69_41105 [Streptomyces sp.]|nr:hypothetical protein [Streptomyces sp.]